MTARDFPTRPVRLVEPFGRGGGPDLVARVLAEPLFTLWRQPVTVENHPGGGGTSGPSFVAASPPDGHTLLVNTSAHAYSAAFADALPYDPAADFVPIAPVTTQPYVLVASLHAGMATLPELLSAGQARSLRFGSTGRGTATHIGVAQLNRELGIDAVHVPASGDAAIADTVGDVASGRIDYALAPISVASPHLREHRLVAIGTTTARRSRLLPEVPTLAEADVVGFDFPVWYGLWAPAGTPSPVVDAIAESIARVLAEPGVQADLRRHDAEVMSMTPREFAEFVARESEAAARILDS